MKHLFRASALLLAMGATSAYADDPPSAAPAPAAAPPAPAATAAPAAPYDPAYDAPRTRVDTNVVGSNVDPNANSSTTAAAASLENDHNFQAGAPDLVRIADKLNLSHRQRVQLNDAIERADAGAAVLIKREHDLRQMIAATTPQDPLYAKLISQQTDAMTQWDKNRDGLRRDVMELLTPAQQSRFEQLQSAN